MTTISLLKARRCLGTVCFALVFALCSSGAALATTITIDDQATFDGLVAGLNFEGLEDFESANMAGLLAVDDPLEFGVVNGPFPTGTTVDGLTLQSNTLEGTPTTTSPRGMEGLATDDSPGTQYVTNALSGDSFDMLFDPGTLAVSFNPLVLNFLGEDADGVFQIRVFDSSNTLIFEQDGIFASSYFDPSSYTLIGIVAMMGQDIGRINLYGTSIMGTDPAPYSRVWTTSASTRIRP